MADATPYDKQSWTVADINSPLNVVRLNYMEDGIYAATGGKVPAGGSVGQTILKNSGVDFDVFWGAPPGVQTVNSATPDQSGNVDIAAEDLGFLGSTPVQLGNGEIPVTVSGGELNVKSFTASGLGLSVSVSGGTEILYTFSPTAVRVEDLAATPVPTYMGGFGFDLDDQDQGFDPQTQARTVIDAAAATHSHYHTYRTITSTGDPNLFFQLSDHGKTIIVNTTTGQDVTLEIKPQTGGSGVAYPSGYWASVVRIGDGAVTVSWPDAAIFVDGVANTSVDLPKHSRNMFVRYPTSNTWERSGAVL